MNSKYLTYEVTDLATDDQFIQWVQAGRPIDSPWSQWLLDHPEVSAKVDESAAIVSAMQYLNKPIPSVQADKIWNRINTTIAENHIEATKTVAMPRRNVFRIIAYLAAAGLTLLFASKLILDSNENIYVGQGASLAYVLPDQSKVELNAVSKLTFDKDLWDTERSLSLEGEGYFEVEKGQKFTVHTDHGNVSVLGTSFNIYSRPDGFSVHCTSGRVKVISGQDEVILTPDTRSILKNGSLIKQDILINKDVDWLNKIYRFDAIPLKVVFEAIERQFDVELTYDKSISDRLYTGSFEATDLDKALNTICFPMELTSNVQGRIIRIYPDEGQ